MFSIRNIGGVALFLFGTTFLWLTPTFAPRGVSTTGIAWSITNIASLLTLAGLCVATWGLFTKAAWWEPVAIAFAILGILALVPYLLADRGVGGTNPAFNAVIHAVGSAAVLALLLVPILERWVSGHVTSGR